MVILNDDGDGERRLQWWERRRSGEESGLTDREIAILATASILRATHTAPALTALLRRCRLPGNTARQTLNGSTAVEAAKTRGGTRASSE